MDDEEEMETLSIRWRDIIEVTPDVIHNLGKKNG